MKEPDLSKITLKSAAVHFIFVILMILTVKTTSQSLQKPVFVDLVEPESISKHDYKPIVKKKISPVEKTTSIKKTASVVSGKESDHQEKTKPKIKQQIPKTRTKSDKQAAFEGERKRTNKVTKVKKSATKKKIQVKKSSPQKAFNASKEDKISKEIKRLQAIKAMERLQNIRKRNKKVNMVLSSAKSGFNPEKMNEYGTLISSLIQNQWVYPETEINNLSNMLALRISADGRILSVKLEESSGNVLFDKSTLNAVSKVEKLPPPPYKMEIGIKFHL